MVKQTEENIQKVSEINQLLQEFWDAQRNIVNGEPQSYAESFFRICNDKIKQLFDDVITADADEGFRLMKEGMDLLCKTLSNIEKEHNHDACD